MLLLCTCDVLMIVVHGANVSSGAPHSHTVASQPKSTQRCPNPEPHSSSDAAVHLLRANHLCTCLRHLNGLGDFRGGDI